MLRCLIDVSIPLESKCAKCCIHCDEKDACDYKCCGIEEWGTEEGIAKNCMECIQC